MGLLVSFFEADANVDADGNVDADALILWADFSVFFADFLLKRRLWVMKSLGSIINIL